MHAITINDIIKEFNFKALSGSDSNLRNQITIIGANRAGLELAGFLPKTQASRRIVWLSSKEHAYVHTLPENLRKERYLKLMNQGIPAIFLSSTFSDDVLVETAKELGFPIIQTHMHSNRFFQQVTDYLELMLTENIEVHATLLNIYGYGVLIEGVSGIGKSEAALTLIRRNFLFVGDDRIIISRKANQLYGIAAPILKDLLEVRGIGILSVIKMFGYGATLNQSPINLVVKLVSDPEGKLRIDRLGAKMRQVKYLDLSVPLITLALKPGRNVADLIETAVLNLKLNELGINAITELNDRIRTINNSKSTTKTPSTKKGKK